MLQEWSGQQFETCWLLGQSAVQYFDTTFLMYVINFELFPNRSWEWMSSSIHDPHIAQCQLQILGLGIKNVVDSWALASKPDFTEFNGDTFLCSRVCRFTNNRLIQLGFQLELMREIGRSGLEGGWCVEKDKLETRKKLVWNLRGWDK